MLLLWFLSVIWANYYNKYRYLFLCTNFA